MGINVDATLTSNGHVYHFKSNGGHEVKTLTDQGDRWEVVTDLINREIDRDDQSQTFGEYIEVSRTEKTDTFLKTEYSSVVSV